MSGKFSMNRNYEGKEGICPDPFVIGRWDFQLGMLLLISLRFLMNKTITNRSILKKIRNLVWSNRSHSWVEEMISNQIETSIFNYTTKAISLKILIKIEDNTEKQILRILTVREMLPDRF